MIDIKQIRENPEKFKKAAKDKHFNVDIDRILDLDSQLLSMKNSEAAERSATGSMAEAGIWKSMTNSIT